MIKQSQSSIIASTLKQRAFIQHRSGIGSLQLVTMQNLNIEEELPWRKRKESEIELGLDQMNFIALQSQLFPRCSQIVSGLQDQLSSISDASHVNSLLFSKLLQPPCSTGLLVTLHCLHNVSELAVVVLTGSCQKQTAVRP